MSKFDPEREVHKAWLGFLQPVGLVVAPPALIKAQVVLDKNAIELQQSLLSVVERPASGESDPDPILTKFQRFAVEVLGWSIEDIAGADGGPMLPESLALALPEYGETLSPTYVVLDGMADGKVLLLVSIVEHGTDLDALPTDTSRHGWHASPEARLERLLRETKVPAGLLCNGKQLRLVYAPHQETAGHITFPVAAMCAVGDRRILAAMHMLLSEHRVFGAPNGQRLLDILAESRKYQSEVSNRLSEQVLSALWELLRGFQAADEAANGKVLCDIARTEPNHIYGGLLTVIMRLVFLLYAEDQGLMSDEPVYTRNYSIGGLYERLREDAGRHPDTMDQRYGAWSWLLSTFRLVFDGGGHAKLSLPPRHGQLFNPDEYPFLEGRPRHVCRVMGDIFDAPRVADGVLWRVLVGLLVLDGERLSYRTLDVEQIGSVYEAMMGFDVQTTTGRSIGVRPKNVVVDLDALLKQPGAKRAEWLKTEGECELSGSGATALKEAKTIDDVVAALGRRVSPQTSRALPPGALFLQPGEERRRSGSHYTPRELTEPIVRTTLKPILEALGPRPTPDQLLELKVCDPAMGSGAFLVEGCRQLADALVDAWQVHDCLPKIPPDETPWLYARRLVAQRCLYGVDKNPFAVNLAKLSLWLITLAKDHAFTFLDHALKHGDSLVGLTREQIGAFHWNPPTRDFSDLPLFANIAASITKADGWRKRIQLLSDGAYDERREAWREAEDELRDARFVGDLCVAAFFGAEKDKDRERLRQNYAFQVDAWRAGNGRLDELTDVVAELRSGKRAVPAFHWEIEFPEVFGRGNSGFDAIVGNPPFLGGKRISTNYGDEMRDWLSVLHIESSSNADLVAHFYRRAFNFLRENGCFGLIATNTIGQGDTRSSGLRFICTHNGSIYAATRRVKWPGLAAVVVSVVHVQRSTWKDSCELDGRPVPMISAFLFHGGGHENPRALAANEGRSFIGSYMLGMGFTFDDKDKKGVASPLSEMERLIKKDPCNAERIFPFIGWSEVASSPTHAHHRYAINFGELTEQEARQWPDLISIVESKVKPERMKKSTEVVAWPWWQYWRTRPELFRAIAGMKRALVAGSQATAHFAFAFLPSGMVYSSNLTVLIIDTFSGFAGVQCTIHEVWSRFFMTTLEDRLVYTPTTCFETFPFPPNWTANPSLEAAGQTYYEYRAALMVKNNEGLTDTYNRFHDPNERAPEILKLRELHAAMDRAVLDAYGWTDISTDCDFFLDYEIDEETWGTKKKPYRYRWPDAVHDEVLARLLELNQLHAQAEQQPAVAATDRPQRGKPPASKAAKSEAPKAKKPSRKKKDDATMPLFGAVDSKDKS